MILRIKSLNGSKLFIKKFSLKKPKDKSTLHAFRRDEKIIYIWVYFNLEIIRFNMVASVIINFKN